MIPGQEDVDLKMRVGVRNNTGDCVCHLYVVDIEAPPCVVVNIYNLISVNCVKNWSVNLPALVKLPTLKMLKSVNYCYNLAYCKFCMLSF